MATYLLVPGGWHGGWYFQSFAEALRVRGHRAYAITLTELGERQHLLRAGLELRGHGRDGVPNQIDAAIYSDAFVPVDGQSWYDLAGEFFQRLSVENAAKGRAVKRLSLPRSQGHASPARIFLAKRAPEECSAPGKTWLRLFERMARDTVHVHLRTSPDGPGMVNI
jgi:hypothetical protein